MRISRSRGVQLGERWPVRAAAAGLALLALSVPLPGDVPAVRSSAVIIPVKGEINDIMRDSIERRIADARAQGAGTLILELNTPGGLVTSALDICRMIKGLPDEYRTVAWVNPSAYSAGAMIAVACNEIYMSRASSIGDCAPIMISPTGVAELGEAERAKAESPILQEFRDSAQRNGYDLLLCRAMVAVGTEVWWIENSETDERRFVTREDKKRLIDEAGEVKTWQPVRTFKDYAGVEQPVEQPIDRADTLLTLSQTEAVGFGFAKGVAGSVEELTQQLQLDVPPKTMEVTYWEHFALWLNSPLVRGILFVLVIVGGYVEFQHPGLILPGSVAAVALVIFLAAPYAAGLADAWTFIILGIGLILLGVELFVLPGFGVAGLLGILCILVSVVGTFVPAEPGTPTFSLPSLQGTWDALKLGIMVISGSIITGLVGIFLVLRYLPQIPVGKQLMLSTPDAKALALSDPYPDVALVGDVGVVVGALRPGGQARFGTEVVDVASQGEYIDAGQRVQVLKREGPTIVVRAVNTEA